MESNKKSVAFVVSYMPMIDLPKVAEHMGKFQLLNPKNGDDKAAAEAGDYIYTVANLMAEADAKCPHTMGILWATDNGKLYAMLLVDENAKELLDNMNQWSDNDIPGRFQWRITKNSDLLTPENVKDTENEFKLTQDLHEPNPEGYTFDIVPNYEKSIERWCQAHQIVNGTTFNKDDYEFKVISIPIRSTQKSKKHLEVAMNMLNEHQPEVLDPYNNDFPINFSIASAADVTSEDSGFEGIDLEKYQKYASTCTWYTLNRAPGRTATRAEQPGHDDYKD